MSIRLPWKLISNQSEPKVYAPASISPLFTDGILSETLIGIAKSSCFILGTLIFMFSNSDFSVFAITITDVLL